MGGKLVDKYKCFSLVDCLHLITHYIINAFLTVSD